MREGEGCARASDLPWIPDEGYRDSQNLAHRLGVNALFCALIGASRAREGHCLATWRPEHWVRTRAADVKPDGFGRYLHPGGACEFYLEYDRGTEGFEALAAKLEGYLRLAAGWTKEGDLTGFPNLLFMGQEGVREGEVVKASRHAIQRLRIRTPLATSFPLYVASEDLLSRSGVLGPVWRHVATDGDRMSLLDLPAQAADLYRTTGASAGTSPTPTRTDGVGSLLLPLPHASPCSRSGCHLEASKRGRDDR